MPGNIDSKGMNHNAINERSLTPEPEERSSKQAKRQIQVIDARLLDGPHKISVSTRARAQSSPKVAVERSGRVFSNVVEPDYPPHSKYAITKLKALRVKAAIELARNYGVEQQLGQKLNDALSALSTNHSQIFDLAQVATLDEIKEAKKQPKKLIKQLISAIEQQQTEESGKPVKLSKKARKKLSKELVHKFNKASADLLGKDPEKWGIIKKEIKHKYINKNNQEELRNYSTQITYAAECTPLKASYGSIRGISSLDSANTEHAVNLREQHWHNSEGEKFSVLCHGVNTPNSKYLKLEKKEVEKGADKRTEEAITMAIESQKEVIARQLETGLLEQGKTGYPSITIPLTSLSLLTPASIHREKGLFKEQKAAWERAEARLADHPQLIQVGGKTVEVKISVATVSTGVNAGALLKSRTAPKFIAKLLDRIGFGKAKDVTGWKYADKVNMEAINKVINNAYDFIEKLPEKASAKEKMVDHLVGQIMDCFIERKHHQDAGDAYKLSTLLGRLCQETNQVVLINCMSGKDRTGKQVAQLIDYTIKEDDSKADGEEGLIEYSQPYTEEDQQRLTNVMLNCGGHEVQEACTGAKGYKVFEGGGLKVASNINNIDKGQHAVVAGLCKAVGS